MGIDQKNGIQIENLEIKYGNFTVIQDFTLSINKGEIVTLFGPSGCGKSTILKAILNQISISNGSILIDGTNAKDFALPLAYTPQANELLPWKTVKQNIEFWHNDTIQFMHKNSIKPMDVIETIELTQQADFMPSQLSGGMERRTALARCMCTNSDFMFLDEAFVAVERRLRRKLMVDIRNAIKINNMTALIISHDYEEAVFMSDRIIKLSANPTAILKNHAVNLPNERTIDTFETQLFEKEILEMVF